MRIHNLAHIVVYVAGTEIILPDVSFEEAHQNYENLNRQWKIEMESQSPAPLLGSDDTIPFDETTIDTEIIE